MLGVPSHSHVSGSILKDRAIIITLNPGRKLPEPPPPPLCLGGNIYPLSRVLVTIGHYKNHPLSWAFPGNLPETTLKNNPCPPQQQKMETCNRPLIYIYIRVGVAWTYILFERPSVFVTFQNNIDIDKQVFVYY